MFFQVFAKIEMMQNENQLFGHHFETAQILLLFFLLEYGCIQ